MSLTARVKLWGKLIGHLGLPSVDSPVASFELSPDFAESGIQISPIHMRHPPNLFRFPERPAATFKGLPGIFADSLPDRFGNQLIDVFMAQKGIPPQELTTIDRLLYVANRGMGAIEYEPGASLPLQRTAVDVQLLAELAELVLARKELLRERLEQAEDRTSALTMIRVGSSAGGARAKALVAISSRGKILDGTVNRGPEFSYWLLKFDSSGNRDRDTGDPRGMPVLEYIYSTIARDIGIALPRTQILESGVERHFLIERFDRVLRNKKLDKVHYASWAGLAHADRDGVNSYEQLVLLCRQLGLGHQADLEVFRRAVFNIVGRNQDDHTKNFGFLMDRNGVWSLAPAFDMVYSYDPTGRWTRNHQSWLNGKNSDFVIEDLIAFGRYCNLSERQARQIVANTVDTFASFSRRAKEADLPAGLRKQVAENLRLGIFN